MKLLTFCAFFCFLNVTFAQKASYDALSIPEALKTNANAVLRSCDLFVDIHSQNSMSIRTQSVLTVLNEQGLRNLSLYENYNKRRKVSKIEAHVYNASGQEIKVIKKRDFKDVSAGGDGSVFDDDRILYAEYIPINYPFTVVFESEVETSNTAFLPSWMPLEGYYVSTEKAKMTITYPEELGFGKKELNFTKEMEVSRNASPGRMEYSVQSVKALKYEDGSPEFKGIAPIVYFKLEKFNLEGVNGQAANWQEFGKWYYDTLLTGTDEIPQPTQEKIKALVGTEKDPLAIARIVYQYVQDRTRYVSIQVGIGGFKPMLAKDVDKLGYGDCKALTNYTRSLLQVVGVPAYYTIVYSGADAQRSLQEDFASVQGDHIILAIPYQNDLVWLECTSQTAPFGHQGTFTDDRKVLLVTPQGGQLVRTKSSLEKNNSQMTRGQYALSPDGSLRGSLSIASKGSQYDNVCRKEALSNEERQDHYKEYFQNISNLKLDNIRLVNDKKAVCFTQEVSLSAAGYASASNDKLLFVPNAFNRDLSTPKRYRNRENSLEIRRGYYDMDEIAITLPEGYQVESLPDPFELVTQYGECRTSIAKNKDNTLTYKREVLLKNGHYGNSEYEGYRLFREQIARNDNAKVVLTKKI